MQITCPECEKKLKVGDDLEGKKVRCPACKALIPVRKSPTIDKRIAGDAARPQDDDAMRCPKCEGAAIRALPANAYSRNPGYACTECSAIMRPPGTAGFYIFAALLGGFVLLMGFGLVIAVVMSDVLNLRSMSGGIVVMVLGGAVAGWAIKQLRLPIPINAPPAPSRKWLWIGVLLFLVVGLPCIGGTLFVGFMYFLKELL